MAMNREPLNKLNKKNNTEVKISFDVQQILLIYDWPGNIRELNNIIERMYVFNSDGVITVENLPYELHELNQGADSDILEIDNYKSSLKNTIETIEAKLILKQLDPNFTLKEVADKLGISIATLERKLVKYKLPRRYKRNG